MAHAASKILVVTGAILAYFASPGFAQSKATPKFEAAAIRPCKADAFPAGRGRGGASENSSEHLSIVCQTVENLIQWAYVRYADGQPLHIGSIPMPIPREPIEGEPPWLTSETFTIDAKPESPQILEMMRGPMLQTLLEDRFGLKIHRVTRQVPVYALVAAKGGPKLNATQKDSCTAPPDFSKGMPPMLTPDQPPPCGAFSPDGRGGTRTYGQTMAGLSAQFSALLDRRVVDRTHAEGTFDIHLAVDFNDLFGRFNGGPPEGDASQRPDRIDPLGAIGAAVRELGLRLESASDAQNFIVVDHVERPSEN